VSEILTLLDAKNQRAIADEIFEDKSPETIKKFPRKNLDVSEPVFIVTDFEEISTEKSRCIRACVYCYGF
jgi:hypothetical protein